MSERIGYSDDDIKQVKEIATLEAKVDYLILAVNRIEENMKDYRVICKDVERHEKLIWSSISAIVIVSIKLVWDTLTNKI